MKRRSQRGQLKRSLTQLRAALSRAALVCCTGAGLLWELDQSVAHTEASPRATAQRVFISAQEAIRALRSGARFLDARERPVSPLLGRIPGAMSAPWRTFSRGRRDGELLPAEALRERIRALGLSGDERVVIYGDWDRGWGEEGRLFWMLDYLGHAQLRVLRGGWSAWRAAGGEVERGFQRARAPGSWLPRPREERRQRLEAYDEEGARLQRVDVRRRAEYQGATPYGSPCGGHIPHAINLHWRSLFDGPRLRDEEALRSIFEGAGLDLTAPIALYCTGGVRSAFVYLVLRDLGALEPRNDDGSWWRWSRRRCEIE